jgi:hypothetical protein
MGVVFVVVVAGPADTVPGVTEGPPVLLAVFAPHHHHVDCEGSRRAATGRTIEKKPIRLVASPCRSERL